jgi:hypothetical protein
MAFSRSRLTLPSFSSLAHGALAALGVLLVLSHTACIDGTTPNCAGDAGCGPGINPDAGVDAADGSADGNSTPLDTGTDAGGSSDASPG